MAPLLQKNRPPHTKGRSQTRTRRMLVCSITLLASLTKSARILKRSQMQALSHMQPAAFNAHWQRHRSIRSQRRSVGCQRQWRAAPPRGQFVLPNSAIRCDSLTAITLTHRAKRTKHALNARQRAAACNASIMRGSPRVTPHFPCTARAPAAGNWGVTWGVTLVLASSGSHVRKREFRLRSCSRVSTR